MKLVEIADHGATRVVWLNRPHKRNALSLDLLHSLARALVQADAEPHITALVLTGRGTTFSAGLDLDELATGRIDHDAVLDEFSPWDALAAMTTPVIGAINGPAVTGGLELALQCDLLVVSDQAVFADTHARVGVHPGGGLTSQLPQAIGIRRAREVVLAGRVVAASEAVEWGLATQVVPPEKLLGTALSLAVRLSDGERACRDAIRQTMRDVQGRPFDEAIQLERERFRAWALQPESVERRRTAIVQDGRRRFTRIR